MQAAGGSESSLFAEDILGMYQAYSRLQGWRLKQETLQADMAIGKGCKYANFTIDGEGAYRQLKHESGVHKVQRVPETEK